VRRVSLNVSANAATATLCAGAIDAGDSSCATGGSARAWPAGSIGVAAAVAGGRSARRRDTGVVLADQPHICTGVADMVGSADIADVTAIGINTAAARVAGPIAQPAASRTGGDASAVGTDIGSTTIATGRAGAADRRATAWDDDAVPIQARLLRTTASHRRATAAQATRIAATGAQRHSPRSRLIGRSAGGYALITGVSGRQAVAAARAIRGIGLNPANAAEQSGSCQAREPPQHIAA
jgi:hypothetical protein